MNWTPSHGMWPTPNCSSTRRVAVIHQQLIAQNSRGNTGKFIRMFQMVQSQNESLIDMSRFSRVGSPFACFYSRAYPEIVITRYSWEDNLKHLILSLIIPNIIFAISIGVLSYWYCPCCDKACRRTTRVYADKEE